MTKELPPSPVAPKSGATKDREVVALIGREQELALTIDRVEGVEQTAGAPTLCMCPRVGQSRTEPENLGSRKSGRSQSSSTDLH